MTDSMPHVMTEMKPINMADKKYHSQGDANAQVPNVFADMIQFIANDDVVTLVFGLKQDTLGIDSDIVNPKVSVTVPKTLFVKMIVSLRESGLMPNADVEK